jgi:hypothetical protein
MVTVIIVAVLGSFILGCVLEHPAREKLFFGCLFIAVLLGLLCLISVPPLVALLFANCSIAGSSVGILLPGSFSIKAFLRRVTS